MSQEIAPAIIAAVAALSGVALSQGLSMILARLDRKYRRKVLLREKYEEMAMHFLESLSWPTRLQTAKNQEALYELSQNLDANKCFLLCSIYFPALRDLSGAYLDSSVSLYNAFVSSYNSNDARPLGEQAIGHSQYSQAKNEFIRTKNALTNAIKIHAASYAVA